MDRTIDGHDCKNEATFVAEENKKSEDFCRDAEDKDKCTESSSHFLKMYADATCLARD